MYKRDKVIAILLFFTTGVIAFVFRLDYSQISSTVFAVVSISIAVYIAVAAALLESKYAISLKNTTDAKIKTKTQLGVLSGYLRWAGRLSILTIAISCFFAVLPSEKLEAFSQHMIKQVNVIATIEQLVSSVAFGVFALNILFLWLIFIFLINSLSKSA